MSDILKYKTINGITFAIIKNTLFSNYSFMKYGDGFIISKDYKTKQGVLNKFKRETK